MAHSSTQSLFDELDDLLENEREALLKGDLEKIAALLASKENLIDKVNALNGTKAEPLKELHSKIVRNQVLLDGALQGIRRASMRLATIRHIRRNLETYGKDGQKKVIEGEVVRKVEKRA
ncbi:flagellar protein FlgN [Roseovarius rhodophyticola]|uniref:Flagellar protein FlgN n=1 Tax=Roseovarius rhodophyticola TaxID=3080827 RepID=A0ABZ2TIU5_9RHOB|nr:flagellar protein FlgN [Roseovarius sp. W115]MDV2929979.1 flagellar protein FlgN [Roseovarius sp. W115]